MVESKEIFDFISQNVSQISEVWLKLVASKLPLDNMFQQVLLRRSLLYIDLHLHYLAGSLVLADPQFYNNYVLWTKRMIGSRNQQMSFVILNFECIKEALKKILPFEYFKVIEPILVEGEALLKIDTPSIPEFYYGKPFDTLIALDYIHLIVKGKKIDAMALIERLINNGMEISKIYQELITPCQYEIGRLWETNQISVAQEHLATAISQYVMANLFPRINAQNLSNISKPKILGVCVGPELHELGLRMIMDMFELKGWDTTFLGANTPIEDLIVMLKIDHFDVLAISIAIVSHIKDVRNVIKQIKQSGKNCPKIMVGGYPFNQNKNLWKIVNADGYGENFNTAFLLALEWIKK